MNHKSGKSNTFVADYERIPTDRLATDHKKRGGT